ncbi:MAG: response regulator [Ketobacter sp.]|nr:MAG: response regulator [Ketobacter sp.]
MEWMKRFKHSALFGMGRDSLAVTFNDELHYHAGWVLLFSCAMSLTWISYIPVDELLHPELGVLAFLRWGLVIVSIVILLLRRIRYLRERNQILLMVWGIYLLGTSGAITGMTAVDPTYVSGFVLVLCLIPMAPLRVPYALTVLAFGLGSLLLFAANTGVDLTHTRVRYTFNDLVVAFMIVTFFIFLMNNYRYRTWKSAKIIERESSIRVQQADLQSQAKSRFIATMSHEIRTPMNGIIGMSEMLQTTPLNKEQKSFVDVISYSSHSLLNVINDILDYSKIEAGRVTLEKTDFDIYELCAEIATIFKSTADKNSIEFVVCVDPAVPTMIKGDPSRLRQVLLNLIGNAFKFTRVGRVEVKLDKRADTVDGGELEFTILDTGIGISQVQQAKLFKPFQQADSSITREYGGSGLGLSISKSLIELMGGEIEVDSAPRQGSTFIFTIYYETAAPLETVCPAPRLSGICLLLAGRPSHYGMELTRHLLHWQMQVVNERQVALAIERLKRNEEGFAVVVLDLDSNSDLDPLLVEQLEGVCRLNGLECLVLSSEQYPRYSFKVMTKPVCAFQFRRPLAHALGLLDENHQNTQINALTSELLGCCVLLVEDNDINQKVITSMLDKLGARYEVAHNGRQACAEYAKSHDDFDVILMDCEMPVMDGEAATRRIRQQEQDENWNRTPIIALTAHAMKEHIDSCLSAGMDDHISKPVEMRVLREKILKAAQTTQSGPG